MASYAYKTILRLIPKDFRDKYEAEWKEETGKEFDYTSDYDGTLWLMAAEYIEYLQGKLKENEAI